MTTASPALTALVLNCTLTPSPDESSTQLLADQVLAGLGKHGVTGDSVRLVDLPIAPGVLTDMGDGDGWPQVRARMLAADILVFATPTWMGHMSSVASRAIERLNAELSETDDEGRPLVYGKVGVVVVVGNEDGAHKITADVFQALGALRQVLDSLRRAMLQPGGCAAVRSRAAALEEAGLFLGTDWASPEILVPALSGAALHSTDADTVLMEATSALRMLAVATGEYAHPSISAAAAHQFLSQVLAMNLELLFTPPSEAERTTQGRTAQLIRDLFRHLGQTVGYETILDRLVEEIWRILRQRPIQVDQVQDMITRIAVYRSDPDVDLGSTGQGVDRLITSLFGTTEACREDPGLEIYRSRLEAMDASGLQYEAAGFARAMHDTGLVSPYHAELLRFLLEEGDYLLAEALGLSGTGRDSMLRFHKLVHRLISEAVHPQTAQCIYGLALMLDRGILYQPAVEPALWRQIALPLSPYAQERLTTAYGPTPAPRARLLSGVLSIMGLPLGIGQGDNPTCQSARALSMWAYNDPDHLLQVLVWAARDDEITMHFEGQPISSRESAGGVATTLPTDLDPVSLLVVPHLDRIYAEMGRRCAERPGDPHRWVNPEFHGWWAGRGFRINVDVATGRLIDLDQFLALLTHPWAR